MTWSSRAIPSVSAASLSLAGDLPVLRARFEPARGMIVRYYHGTGPVGDGVRVDLAGMGRPFY